MSEAVRVAMSDGGSTWRVTFGRAPGNVLDVVHLEALARVFREAGQSPSVKAICLEGHGSDFSFGASIEEHLPGRVEAMLLGVRDLVLAILDSHVVVAAAVRGRCLGGGLELASLCHRVFAAADATFGQPEIALGVFAPVASIVLEGRVGRGAAEDLCLTGRTVGAAEALGMGLIDEVVAGDPAMAAFDWVQRHFGSRSTSSLRFAVRAVRTSLVARVLETLPVLERMYLTDLMATGDAVEGLRAFLERRPARWARQADSR